jgi:hypothetical protein
VSTEAVWDWTHLNAKIECTKDDFDFYRPKCNYLFYGCILFYLGLKALLLLLMEVSYLGNLRYNRAVKFARYLDFGVSV